MFQSNYCPMDSHPTLYNYTSAIADENATDIILFSEVINHRHGRTYKPDAVLDPSNTTLQHKLTSALN